MTNPEKRPVEQWCGTETPAPRAAIELLEPRDVPLGGPRAMTVRRTLPQRQRSLIGAWCFVDHYGPDDVAETGGMDVAPHPHTGLQTVSWLFTGEIEHRDSHGVHARVRPGELNLMTAGHGICHSEVSMPDTAVLHGVQLWVALPGAHRDVPRDFAHFAPVPVERDGVRLSVFLGELADQASPVTTFTPLLGAELVLAPGARFDAEVDPAYEHGVLVDTGEVGVDGTPVAQGVLAYAPPGARRLNLANEGATSARVIVLGGAPLDEEILMWWNFVGRTHEEIVAFRAAWEERSARFGEVDGYGGEPGRLPAPALPPVRIRPRRNR
ncbi:pirin family protein [Mariniluteicoccus flavus]